jgi:hypothetical protein
MIAARIISSEPRHRHFALPVLLVDILLDIFAFKCQLLQIKIGLELGHKTSKSMSWPKQGWNCDVCYLLSTAGQVFNPCGAFFGGVKGLRLRRALAVSDARARYKNSFAEQQSLLYIKIQRKTSHSRKSAGGEKPVALVVM